MADERDPVLELEDRLDAEFAPAWRPEPGDKLIGRLIAVRTWSGAYGTYPILTIERAGGEQLSVHAFRQVLASALAETRPVVGELVGIKFEGIVTDASGPDYYAYRVVTERDQSAEIDWRAYEAGIPPAGAASELHRPLDAPDPVLDPLDHEPKPGDLELELNAELGFEGKP